MKVLLINPPRFHELIGKNPAIVEKHRGFNPPLGILSLAGYLERHTDHEIRVIDAQPLGWGYSELKENIARESFAMVTYSGSNAQGLTTRNNTDCAETRILDPRLCVKIKHHRRVTPCRHALGAPPRLKRRGDAP